MENEESEIVFLNKVLEKLISYHCGYHKQLKKMILNRIKLRSRRKKENRKKGSNLKRSFEQSGH